MPVPGGTDTFASILARGQQPPETSSGEGKDLPDGFPLPVAPHHRVVDSSKDPTAIQGLIAYDFTCKRAVYVIYRPWDHCDRCKSEIGNNQVMLPVDGDYTCPHTQLGQYEAVLNKTLSGEWLFGSETETAQKDGSIVISLKWFEKKLNPNRKKRAGAGHDPPSQQDEPDL